MIGIYKITNLINNKVYIGQSINIEKRWTRHKSDSKHKHEPLYKAIRKYGLENFKFEVIEECSLIQLDDLEVKWIKYYNSCNYKFGYNISDGGKANRHFMKISVELLDAITLELIKTTDSYLEIAKKFNVTRDLVRRINLGITWPREGLTYPLGNHRVYAETRAIHYCIDCGRQISSIAIRCQKCSVRHLQEIGAASFKTNIPEKPILIELLKKYNFVEVGKQYNVTCNTVKKWCIKYQLPSHAKELKEYLKTI